VTFNCKPVGVVGVGGFSDIVAETSGGDVVPVAVGGGGPVVSLPVVTGGPVDGTGGPVAAKCEINAVFVRSGELIG